MGLAFVHFQKYWLLSHFCTNSKPCICKIREFEAMLIKALLLTFVFAAVWIGRIQGSTIPNSACQIIDTIIVGVTVAFFFITWIIAGTTCPIVVTFWKWSLVSNLILILWAFFVLQYQLSHFWRPFLKQVAKNYRTQLIIQDLKDIQDKNGIAYFWLTNLSLLFAADFQANPSDISCKK